MKRLSLKTRSILLALIALAGSQQPWAPAQRERTMHKTTQVIAVLVGALHKLIDDAIRL